MGEEKRVLLTLPGALLERLDRVAANKGMDRNTCIRCALQLYVGQEHKLYIRDSMVRGYVQMADINREWARSGQETEARVLEAYEALLSECE